MSEAIDAIYWAVDHGADLINMSLSWRSSTCRQEMQNAVDYALTHNVFDPAVVEVVDATPSTETAVVSGAETAPALPTGTAADPADPEQPAVLETNSIRPNRTVNLLLGGAGCLGSTAMLGFVVWIFIFNSSRNSSAQK